MIAARNGRSYVEFGQWDRFVQSMDWTRIHLQACGEHIRHCTRDGLVVNEDTTCGSCIAAVLRRNEDDAPLGPRLFRSSCEDPE